MAERTSEGDRQQGDPVGAGEFVRGYFKWLDEQGVAAAVLHGWRGGFEGALTDVDHVLSAAGFARVTALVSAYCQSVGWRLCQVMRHETTAAFCVCSARTNPGQVVALDACSDYRRRERLLLTVDELLEGRRPLPSGGYRLSEETELRYRMLKAAVKQKAAELLAEDFAGYSEAAHQACAAWLERRWGVVLIGWQPAALAAAWQELDRRTLRNRGAAFSVGALARIMRRLARPTGLVVVTGQQMDEEVMAAIFETFGRLYFRRTARREEWSVQDFRALATSTLVIVKRMGSAWKTMLGRDCWLEFQGDEEVAQITARIADHLERRCARRERLRADFPS